MIHRILAAMLCLADTAAAAAPPRIDHILLGIDDLDRGIAEMARRTGITATIGGVHPGRGTRNALISLGDGHYVEIIAPDPAQPAPAGELSQFWGRLLAAKSLTPIGWAVATDDPAALRTTLTAVGVLTTAPTPGARALPDGSRLAWASFEPTGAAPALAPFFIAWGPGTAHPSTTAPGGCRLAALRLATPDPAPLRRILDPLRLPVAIDPADKDRITLTLACPTASVSFE